MAGSKAYLLLKQSGDLYFTDFGDDRKLVEVIAGARCKITESKLRNAIMPLKASSLQKPERALEALKSAKISGAFSSRLALSISPETISRFSPDCPALLLLLFESRLGNWANLLS